MAGIRKLRLLAFHRQNGKCCYCGFLMWLDSAESFAKQHGITIKQARHFQCTAEHLHARQDGGRDVRENIAAACIRCNQLRHRRQKPMPPEQYQQLVVSRVSKGGWHNVPKLAIC
ncbi:HNH endonuclease [Ectopseudomonas oleovorans]|uniref:HNH endonuclease n=1 Tax=Ectopseudomonas oleovorans TaxID=301 RepID=A0A397M154_ECTOL|nr:HNH endonuclease [Pseudomonas oleovorans]